MYLGHLNLGARSGILAPNTLPVTQEYFFLWSWPNCGGLLDASLRPSLISLLPKNNAGRRLQSSWKQLGPMVANKHYSSISWVGRGGEWVAVLRRCVSLISQHSFSQCWDLTAPAQLRECVWPR